jgi:hypothetical protein
MLCAWGSDFARVRELRRGGTRPSRRSAVRREGGSSQTMSKSLVDWRVGGFVIFAIHQFTKPTDSPIRELTTEYPANGSFFFPLAHAVVCVH